MTDFFGVPAELPHDSSWDSVTLVMEHAKPLVLLKREISKRPQRVVIETVLHGAPHFLHRTIE